MIVSMKVCYSRELSSLHNIILQGLPCGAITSLKPGDSYNISSKICSNGLYPNSAYCSWYFDVDGCIPSLFCDKLDIMGDPRRRFVHLQIFKQKFDTKLKVPRGQIIHRDCQ